MKKKWISTIILILTITMSAGLFIYINFTSSNEDERKITENSNNYDISEETKYALKSLSSQKEAKIISDVETSSDIVSLSFENIEDKETVEKILKLLEKYNVKATFFISGIKAAEDTESIKKIKNAGHEIGSESLSGAKSMEKLSNEELITDFCKTNKILEDITGNKPELLKCNSTLYTDKVLSTAYASGNKYVLKSSHYINYQSFKDYNQTKSYIKKIKNGTILSIKVNGVLDASEYQEERKEEKPAIDKQAGIDESTNEDREEVTIFQTVEWILKSLKIQKKEVVQVSNLANISTNGIVPLLKNISNKEDIYIDKQYNNEPSTLLKKSNTLFSEKKSNNSKSNSTINSKSEEKKEVDLVNFKELIEKNNGKLAPYVSEFYTTQKALSYTFRGLSNEVVLDTVLGTLNKINAKATFFVTKEEIEKYPDRIDKILKSGNEIGNGGITNSSKLLDKSTEEICKEIYEVDELLKKHGINTNAYMPGYGYVNANIQEALSSINSIDGLKNYELFTYSKAPINAKEKNMSPEEIVNNYFDIKNYTSLRKGEIVYFRLNSELFEDNNTVSRIIYLLTTNYVKNGYAHKYDEVSKSYILAEKPLGYSVVSLKDLQNTFEIGAQLGRYKLQGNNAKALNKRTYEDAISIMHDNYIGNEDVNLSHLSESEQLLMDKTGTINTNGENVIFFTFDDWGGDAVVNEILDVLNKHNVKGSFFIISKNIDINSGMSNANPNLLRTIALNGHDIGSHTYNHDILDSNKEYLDVSLDKSYNSMANVIGDLDSLKPYFRPPTLLITKEGLESVFERGFEYCISGNISTHDYENSSAQEIVDSIGDSLVKGQGNVVVMHMNNQAYYTAEAIDIFLTNNEKGLYGEKYKIAKLSDYLEK